MTESEGVDAVEELIKTYNELNSPCITELDEDPSPLEFMRFVARNTPFVIRGGAAEWTATQTWSAEFLEKHLKEETVNVAVTPLGNADSPTIHKDGNLVFAKPWEEDQSFPDFLRYVIDQEKTAPSSDQPPTLTEVRYAQTQNDNLRHEYLSLFNHVQRDIPFVRIALQQSSPDAINLWIGNSRSVTALHRDNYENIYVQVLGKKHFVLLPLSCHACVNEQPLRPARYRRQDGEDVVDAKGGGGGGGDGCGLTLELDQGDQDQDQDEGQEKEAQDGYVPFALWDPDHPGENATAYSALAQPMRVTLEPGDMLYLPAMWYHKVSQSCNDDGICVAVNYWYDMDFTGPLYPLSNLARTIGNSSNGRAS